MRLRAIPVEHADQVERLRILRNMTRDGFSTDTSWISELDQAIWWERMRGRVKAWLYATGHGIVVGFGVLRQTDDGRWWTTVGVDPDWTGRGFGKAITHDIVTRCPEPPWATARKDNPAAVRLHVEEDWEVIDGPDERLVYFRARRIWPSDGAREQWVTEGWAVQ